MEPALQRRVQRYGWDKAASYYENTWQQQLKPAHDALFDFANIQQGQKIIDIACGTVLISFRASAATGSEGFVLGTDISDKMIEIADKTSKENSLNNIRFERMDAEELKISAEEFDVAICALGLMYAPSPLNALKEMYRVLKKVGICVAAVWGKRENCGWADLFEIVDKRVSSEVCPMFFNLGNDKVLEKNFELAGFSNYKTKRIQSSLEYGTDEAACAAAFEGGPVALAYFKFPENVKKEACQEYLASIEKYKTEKGYSVPGEFIIGLGIK
jgi:ubiquinone/menaquinone biosynthesis C-methylase UbiE